MEVFVRPWGAYEILLDSSYCKVKRITVESQQRLSYQYHHKRSEVWTIIQGHGKMILNENETDISAGDIVEIPALTKHRIENIGKEKLVFIEIQQGTYFGEDDIVRLEDDYNRGNATYE